MLYAWLLYSSKGPWTKTMGYALSTSRVILVALLFVLLLGPILRQIENNTEKPTFVIAVDNSASVSEVMDSLSVSQVLEGLTDLQGAIVDNNYETTIRTFNSQPNDLAGLEFNHESTDLNKLLRDIQNEFEGRNLAGVILVSDGIYNLGASPTFNSYGFELFTVGIGDTIPHKDVSLKSLRYNRISYQGNKFPVIAEIANEGYDGEVVRVTARKDGAVVASEQLTLSAGNRLESVEFLLEAEEEGIQRYEITTTPLEGELTTKNNTQQAYVDIVEGKENILLLAPSPHPDIKAISGAIESNENYKLELFIPGVSEKNLADIQKEKFDLVIFHQVPDLSGRLTPAFQHYMNEEVSTLIVVGKQTHLRNFNTLNPVLQIKTNRFDADNVTGVFNTVFSHFTLTEELQSLFSELPPITVPFGEIEYKGEVEPLLYQKFGNVETSNPLLVFRDESGIKSAVLLGEGTWRWRLHEYFQDEDRTKFNELISKVVQFLSSKEDKRKFKVYPLRNEVSTTDGVVFEAELYDDLYERVYENEIVLNITNSEEKQTQYTFVTNQNSSQYTINNLEEGVYRYTATTNYNAERYQVSGEFLVREQQLEGVNLTADHNVLRELSSSTNGTFVKAQDLDLLQNELDARNYQGLIHSSESYLPLINLKYLFFLLLLIVSLEWFARKYSGAY